MGMAVDLEVREDKRVLQTSLVRWAVGLCLQLQNGWSRRRRHGPAV